MDDLISRQAAIDALKAIRYGLWEIDIPSPTVPEYVEHHEQIKNMMEITDGWIKKLEEQPTADVVEVTRCFECKYHYKDGDNVVTSHCLLNHNHVQPSDWFCADGERKETEDAEVLQ